MKHLNLLLTILLVIQQCHLFFKVEANGRRVGNDFIRVRGTRFLLNGSPYYANGFNAYWLMYMASNPSQRHFVSNVFHEASSHSLSVARTWAFNDGGDRALQLSPGSYDEHVFQVFIHSFVFYYIRRSPICRVVSYRVFPSKNTVQARQARYYIMLCVPAWYRLLCQA